MENPLPMIEKPSQVKMTVWPNFRMNGSIFLLPFPPSTEDGNLIDIIQPLITF